MAGIIRGAEDTRQPHEIEGISYREWVIKEIEEGGGLWGEEGELDKAFGEQFMETAGWGSASEGPDVWDEYSLKILDELEGIESGRVKTAAELHAAEMGRKLSTATSSLMKSRRGVTPGASFSTGAQQSSLVRGVGRQTSGAIGKRAREQAGKDVLQFRAAKESERRGIGMSIMQMNQAAAIAEEQASMTLFGSFLSFVGSIGAGLLFG